MPAKQRILYLMHVDWKWIKQRPHLLAENLSGYFDVDVYYGRTFHKKSNVIRNSNPENLRLTPIIRLPMVLNKFRLLRKCVILLNRFLIDSKARQYDIIWFCHPVFFDDVKHLLRPGVKVIYDCMDDVLEFPSVKKDKRLRSYLSGLEAQLVKRADAVLCSAEKLMMRMRKYHGVKNLHLVNNGIQDAALSNKKSVSSVQAADHFKESGVHATYIGTIAEWMDFPLVLESLERFGNVHYHFFGPAVPGLELPAHPRLHFHGPVPHDQVNAIMRKSDLLVMPFIVNELILSVDPVKLYEYVYVAKPVLAVRYPESEKFGPYVYLYRNRKEYLNVIELASEGRLKPKKNAKACAVFAKNNTWEVRAKKIAGIVRALAE